MNDNIKFEIIRKPKKSNNYLATIAIGRRYYDDWFEISLPSWKEYSEKNDIGIIVFIDDLISRNNSYWKKATWQKLLIGSVFKENNIAATNICYLDTDILINEYAPNVFDNYQKENIGLVSLRKNLPFPYNETLRRMAYLRHNHYDYNYPLDSALFISIEDLYKYHNFEPQNDEFCAGFFIFNLENHTDLMKSWFFKYTRDVDSITGGGDQTHLNYEFLSYGKVQWMNYKFQAIWAFEMAWKYPFLYNYGKNDITLIKECIEASLTTNYFLHFAGSWHESKMWQIGGFFNDINKQKELKNYYQYLKTPVTGQPQGIVKPK